MLVLATAVVRNTLHLSARCSALQYYSLSVPVSVSLHLSVYLSALFDRSAWGEVGVLCFSNHTKFHHTVEPNLLPNSQDPATALVAMGLGTPVLNQIIVLEALEPHRRLGKQNNRLPTHRGLPNGVDLGHLGTPPDILLFLALPKPLPFHRHV